MSPEILYLDNHLLVAVKPPNVPSQADASGDADMLTILKDFLKEKFGKPGNVYLGLLHRLDRPAGGLMAFARTSKAAARLSAAFAGREVAKKYLAVARGGPHGAVEMTDWLLKGENGSVRAVPSRSPGAKEARLISRPLGAREGLVLAEVELFTGRAHQIRVQHAERGHPLWGDARYGGGRPGEQLALWAARLALPHPTLKETMAFDRPPPDAGIWRLFREEIRAQEWLGPRERGIL